MSVYDLILQNQIVLNGNYRQLRWNGGQVEENIDGSWVEANFSPDLFEGLQRWYVNVCSGPEGQDWWLEEFNNQDERRVTDSFGNAGAWVALPPV